MSENTYLRELEKALVKSNPWNKDDNGRWVCIHCGSFYDWNLNEIQEHNPECIWVIAGGE